MKIEGAKNARAVIKQFHSCLNSPSLLPAQVYTPSQHGAYPVLWVNQIIGLMVSHNYEPIPLTIRRAYKALDNLNDKPVFDSYKKVALSYLSQVSFFLSNFTDIESVESLIPKEVLEAGEQEPPNYNIQGFSFEKV